MAEKKIWYTVPDYQGYPTRVPEDKVQAFLKRQEELKAMVERGEEIKPDPEQAKAVKASLKKYLEKLEEGSGN